MSNLQNSIHPTQIQWTSSSSSTTFVHLQVVKAQKEEPSVDESKLSRALGRWRKLKENKLPESRLIAYGKVPASSENKSKS